MRLELSPSEIHVWRTPIAAPADFRRSCKEWLSEDERVRASRCRLEKLRWQFIVRRGLLRALLARYLEARPEDLRFAYSGKGKPRLVGDPAWEHLQFNCSHSDGMALIALTQHREIGIDVEKIRPDVRHAEIAARYFAPSEAAELFRQPEDRQRELFFRYWTCKEAWIKAEGGGLSLPLEQFEVQLQSDDRPAPVSTSSDFADRHLGYVYPLEVASGYAAALAAGEAGLEIRLSDWTPTLAQQRSM